MYENDGSPFQKKKFFGGIVISYETFVVAEGGQYIILKYIISNNGDTLTSINHEKKIMFILKR